MDAQNLEVLGAQVFLLGCMERIAYRLRFVTQPTGGFIEDRLVDLARVAGSLPDLTLTCVNKAINWGDGPPRPAVHMDLEIDVMTQAFSEKLLQAVHDVADRQRLCFFLPSYFSPDQGEKASRVVKSLRQAGFSFGLRDAGGGNTAVENLMLMEPAWIRLSPQLCAGVGQSRAKREKLEHWVRLLATLKTPLLADQAAEKDMAVLSELGILGTVTAKLSREIKI